MPVLWSVFDVWRVEFCKNFWPFLLFREGYSGWLLSKYSNEETVTTRVAVELFSLFHYFKGHMQFNPWKTNVHAPCGWWGFYTCGWCGVIWTYDAFVFAKFLCVFAWKHTFECFWILPHPQYPQYSHFLILKTNMKWETHCPSPAAVYSCFR